MSQPLLLAAAAEAAADMYNSHSGSNPVEELFWALIGIAVTIVIVRTTMHLRRQLPGTDPVNSATMRVQDPEAVLLLKLGQWRSSAMILITATALGLLVRWSQLLNSTSFAANGADLTYAMAGGLDFYKFTFIPVLAWHLADLIERPRAKSRLLAALTSHALMTGVLFAFSLAWVLDSTGWFTEIRTCDGVFLLLSEACWYTHPAIRVPTLLLLLAPLPITLVKLAVALRFRLGPRS